MTEGGDLDTRLRAAMFAHLNQVRAAHPDGVPSNVINSFVFDGKPMQLIVQPGIRKPAVLNAALTIRTTWTPPGAAAPYADEVSSDGSLRYKWRGTDPNQADNRALREAMIRGAPLAYFYPVARGVYEALYPVYLYESQCALCRLRHAPLLDAAHILPDHHERGEPVVPNGLAMCKIHHAAYDSNIIGIRPDRVVEVRHDVLAEIDGPMLRHGLQEMHGTTMALPRSRRDHPDRDRLGERYEQFRAAA